MIFLKTKGLDFLRTRGFSEIFEGFLENKRTGFSEKNMIFGDLKTKECYVP